MFSISSCSSHQAIKCLTVAGQTPVVVEVTDAGSGRPGGLEGLLEATTTQDTYPYVFLKGRFVGGCNDGPEEEWMGIKPIIKRGELAKFLK